jgi:hypothetical protein
MGLARIWRSASRWQRPGPCRASPAPPAWAPHRPPQRFRRRHDGWHAYLVAQCKPRPLRRGVIRSIPSASSLKRTMPELIRQLKAGGYKVVHMVPKGELTTVPKYDEMLSHEDKLSSNNTRPESSVIRTIGE